MCNTKSDAKCAEPIKNKLNPVECTPKILTEMSELTTNLNTKISSLFDINLSGSNVNDVPYKCLKAVTKGKLINFQHFFF